jgi:peptidoglycan/LPS O-acetylase OafA/YrhL
MKITLIVGNIMALGGLVTAIYYLLTTRGPNTFPPNCDFSIQCKLQKIKRLRKFGASLMAVIAFLFLIAVNFFVNNRTPSMIIFWFLLLIMLLWLLILGALDLLAVGRLRKQLDAQADDQLKRIMKNNPFPTKVKKDDE